MAKTISVKHLITANQCKTTIKLDDGSNHSVIFKRTGQGSYKCNGDAFDGIINLPPEVYQLADTMDWMEVCQYLKG